MIHKLRMAALTGALLGCVLLCGALSWAQAPSQVSGAAPTMVSTATTGFDPAKYGMATFSDPRQLYSVLIQPGRCPPKETAEPKQPCALIFYRPELNGTKQAFNFKPVFKVLGEKSIWAMHDGALQKVTAENLYWDALMIRGVRHKYVSIAVIGNAENRANCEAKRLCLADLVAEDMFRQYGKMPGDVVHELWGRKDPTTVRIR